MKQLRVLLVEDDLDLIEDLPRTLATYDINCVATSDSNEAVMRVQEGSHDCVILDLKMPYPEDMTDDETKGGRLTGLVVCRRIRRFDAKTPILVVTSITDPAVHADVLRAGVNKVLCKPVFPDEIVNAIRAMTRGART